LFKKANIYNETIKNSALQKKTFAEADKEFTANTNTYINSVIARAAADKLATEPNGAELNYVPKLPEVLFSTPLVNPQKTYSMTIKIPETVGEYPYICSFPGHWRIMNGVMKVIAK
jgi:azurin